MRTAYASIVTRFHGALHTGEASSRTGAELRHAALQVVEAGLISSQPCRRRSAELTQTQYVVLANTALQTASKVNLVSNNLTEVASDCPPLAEGTQPVPPSEHFVDQRTR